MQLVKKFPAFHGTRRFITALTSVRQLSLSWASPIQSIYSHPTSWRSVLILSAHLRLGLPSGSFPPVSQPRPYTPPLLTHTRHMPSPSHSSRSILILSTHLHLGLPSGLLSSCFPTKNLYTPSPHPYAPHAQPISFFSIHPNIIHPSTPRSPQWSPSLRFPHQDPIHPSPHPYAPHAKPISFFSIHPNIIHPSTPRSPQCSPSLRFPHQDPIHSLSSPIRATCPAHLILLDPS